MLRHRLSSGMLRAQAQASAQASAHASCAIPPVPSLPRGFSSLATSSLSARSAQSPLARAQEGARGLASTVLLSSREERWEGRTVKGLKEALSQRGLAVTGNKSALVQRLQAFESAQQGLSTTSGSSAAPAPTGRSTTRRALSSSRSTAKSKSNADPKTTTAPTATSSGATATSGSAVTDAPPPTAAPTPSDPDALVPPDVKVNDLRSAPGMLQGSAQGEKAEETEQVDESVAPGLPDSGVVPGQVDRVEMAWQMPAYEETSEQLAVPPFTPDAFHSTAAQSMSPPSEPTSQAPKVMTVASASTHASSPQHGVHETFDHDSAPPEDAEASSSSGNGSGLSLPSLGLSNLGIDVGSLVALPSVAPEKDAQAFKPITRPMNDEERRGAYILLGVVVSGLLLGGAPKSAEEKERARREKEEKKKQKEEKN